MSIFNFISNIFKPAADLVDNIHTSEEEKLNLRNELVSMQNQMALKVLEYEKGLMEAQASVIKAEEQGHSWLQRNWRPITMLVFVFIVAWNYIIAAIFNLSQLDVPDGMWSLLKIGIGGYIIGRSAEKTIPGVVKAVKEKETQTSGI
jgi:hypothetical protein